MSSRTSADLRPLLAMPEALDWIQSFLANPGVNLLEPTQASMDQTIRWMRQFNLGRKRILDTHLAAILHTRHDPLHDPLCGIPLDGDFASGQHQLHAVRKPIIPDRASVK